MNHEPDTLATSVHGEAAPATNEPVYMGLTNERVSRPRFYVARALTVPVLVLAMGPMVALHFSHRLDSHFLAWTQLALTAPVFIWCGAFFIRRWWISLRERDTFWRTIGHGAARMLVAEGVIAAPIPAALLIGSTPTAGRKTREGGSERALFLSLTKQNSKTTSSHENQHWIP